MVERPAAPRALSRTRRLTALVVLKEAGGVMAPEDLAVEVASREAGVSASSVENDHVERVLFALRRVHLPALTEAGLLTHASEHEVGLADDVHGVRRVLDAVFAEEVGVGT